MNRGRQKLEADLGRFMRQYRRKRHPNWDPNDRHYDRKGEKKRKKGQAVPFSCPILAEEYITPSYKGVTCPYAMRRSERVWP